MVSIVAAKFELLSARMNERFKRQWAACEALALGRGGVSAVAEATGLSRTTIHRGIEEIREQHPELLANSTQSRIRAPGAGRPRLVDKAPSLEADLKALLDASTRGDPMCPLLWTSKSTRTLAKELARAGHKVSHMTVARLLDQLGYSLQANRKTKEGTDNPRRAVPAHLQARSGIPASWSAGDLR